MADEIKRLRSVSTQEDWERVLSAAAQLQNIIPDAVLVGGSASAIHAQHRFSKDDDHVVINLKERFAEILEQLESAAGWSTARLAPPVQILGNLHGIDTGVRNLRRTQPLETEERQTPYGPIVLPTLEEMCRIKAYLIVARNTTRDYIDFVALADLIEKKSGISAVWNAISTLDMLYPQENGSSVRQQLAKQLAEPLPFDLDTGDLKQYRLISDAWNSWDKVSKTCRRYAGEFLKKF